MAETRRLSELVERAKSVIDLPEGPVTVALSGGADSAALAYLARVMEAAVDAIHVNHGFETSPLLEKAARVIADQVGIGITVEHIQLGDGASPEAQARDARYEVLTRLTGPVLTAHTRDDHAETILINLIRGTGPAGLVGIPSHRPPNVFRPILRLTRSDTREIAGLAGLDYVDDPMNDDDRLLRSRVRMQLIPLLASLNPRIVDSLARTAETIGRDTSLLEEMRSKVPGEPLVISVLITVPRPIADRVLISSLSSRGIPPTTDMLARAWSVIRGESDRQDLVSGHAIRRAGPLLVID